MTTSPIFETTTVDGFDVAVAVERSPRMGNLLLVARDLCTGAAVFALPTFHATEGIIRQTFDEVDTLAILARLAEIAA